MRMPSIPFWYLKITRPTKSLRKQIFLSYFFFTHRFFSFINFKMIEHFVFVCITKCADQKLFCRRCARSMKDRRLHRPAPLPLGRPRHDRPTLKIGLSNRTADRKSMKILNWRMHVSSNPCLTRLESSNPATRCSMINISKPWFTEDVSAGNEAQSRWMVFIYLFIYSCAFIN